MSHIDSFKHALVGEFIGVPVYLTLESIAGDFRCPARHLVIGGGSGEHPALVVANPLAAVARFLVEELQTLKLDGKTRDAWRGACLPFVRQDSEILTFCDWTADDHEEFRTRCESPFHLNSYAIYKSRMSLEEWLILGLGEFIFFAMPSLAQDIMDRIESPHGPFRHIRYSVILLVPPNMPVYANGGNAFRSVLGV